MLSDQAPKEGISGTPPYFWMASRLRPQRARTAHCLVGGPADLGAFLEACHCVLEGDLADPCRPVKVDGCRRVRSEDLAVYVARIPALW